jgi:1,2-diacylglycerol 3-alpha-glucosyltransferase
MTFAISFTNFGPYHLARMRALATRLARSGDRLLAIETAGMERRYPWLPSRRLEAFEWVTLFPERSLESVPRAACARGIREALDRGRPDGVGIVGYSRPESMAALDWARRAGRPTILMSETQEIDHPRVWWKEAIKRRRVSRFSAGLVGGPRHRAYLAELGMPEDRIALGFDAVDNDWYAHRVREVQRDPASRDGLPQAPYFLAVSRFVPEKNLGRLIRSFARYRREFSDGQGWDLVLCGDGPAASEVEAAVQASGVGHAIHRPGFLQADELVRWYAFASAFVHPSRMEPWGLVVNEAAACGLPLLISDRAGCAETLVPDPAGTTGRRFDPNNEAELVDGLCWLAQLTPDERTAMGGRAAQTVAAWGPERFAEGTLEALELASLAGPSGRPARRMALTSSGKDM